MGLQEPIKEDAMDHAESVDASQEAPLIQKRAHTPLPDIRSHLRNNDQGAWPKIAPPKDSGSNQLESDPPAVPDRLPNNDRSRAATNTGMATNSEGQNLGANARLASSDPPDIYRAADSKEESAQNGGDTLDAYEEAIADQK